LGGGAPDEAGFAVVELDRQSGVGDGDGEGAVGVEPRATGRGPMTTTEPVRVQRRASNSGAGVEVTRPAGALAACGGPKIDTRLAH
jgi:hypothetical protein